MNEQKPASDAKVTPVTGGLMQGKRGLVMGVANDRSIGWGIAETLAAHGAEIGFTYQNEAIERRLRPLAESVGSNVIVQCDVEDEASIANVIDQSVSAWGSIDFIVHAIAYSDKQELKGRYIGTTRDNFLRTMDVSCYSFTTLARHAAPAMTNGGSMIALSFSGSNRVVPHYNVMGVAKAALEATVRYLANDLGREGIRVNAISPGPMKTLAGAAIGGARATFKHTDKNAPLGSNATLEAVGGTAVYLASDAGACTTGEIIRVDGGFHVLGMPQQENL